ncbi:MAG: hypothetical protein ACYDEP_09560 [Acidimicrobiales bacterium]|jgi:hypothetical protein
MGDSYDTAMGLLNEAATALEAASGACEEPGDASDLLSLADRIRSYLSTSRPTTPLGMPRISSSGSTLSEEMVIRRNGQDDRGHVRIVPQRSQ